MAKKNAPKRTKNQGYPLNIKKAKRIAVESMGMQAFCDGMGVTKNVYYRWRRQFPAFAQVAEIVKKKSGGKPSWQPQLEKITQLSAMGLNKGQVAAQLGVRYSVYMDHQRKNPAINEAFERGQEMGVATIKGVLYSMATQKNLPAVLAFLKRHDHETEEMPTKIVTEVVYTELDAKGRPVDAEE